MNKKGQSIIEYTLIAVLVLLGVYFMGPYVLRSINAHFKLWDEGVRDSFEEDLRQAPVNDVPFINTDCQCNAVESQSCGSNNPGSLCGNNESEVDYVCTIQGCNGAQGNSYCEPNPNCCNDVNEGCGDVPLNETPPANNCNYGYRLKEQSCGSTTSYQCSQDNSCPLPTCVGLIQSQGSTLFCATGSSTAPTGLNQNTPITYVQAANANSCPSSRNNSTCTYCNGASPCQAYCANGYILNSSGTACVPNYPFVWWSATFTDTGCGKQNTISMTATPSSQYTCCIVGMESDYSSYQSPDVGASISTDSTGNYNLYLEQEPPHSNCGGMDQVYTYGFCVPDTSYQCPCAPGSGTNCQATYASSNYCGVESSCQSSSGTCSATSTTTGPSYQCSTCSYNNNVSPANPGLYCPSCTIDGVTYQDPYMQTDSGKTQYNCLWPSINPNQGKVKYIFYDVSFGGVTTVDPVSFTLGCQGTLPSTETACPNNPVATNSNSQQYTLSSTNTCDGKTPCQVTCAAGYGLQNGSCVQYQCQGQLPANSSLCYPNLSPTNFTTSYSLVPAPIFGISKCTYTPCLAQCNSGYYTVSNGECVLGFQSSR